MFCSIINSNTFEFTASQIYAYDMRKSNFPDFQGIFLNFPRLLKIPNFLDQAENSPTLNFPDQWQNLLDTTTIRFTEVTDI